MFSRIVRMFGGVILAGALFWGGWMVRVLTVEPSGLMPVVPALCMALLVWAGAYVFSAVVLSPAVLWLLRSLR